MPKTKTVACDYSVNFSNKDHLNRWLGKYFPEREASGKKDGEYIIAEGMLQLTENRVDVWEDIVGCVECVDKECIHV
jgi:hypothetical protein